jgi:hypothetical protein
MFTTAVSDDEDVHNAPCIFLNLIPSLAKRGKGDLAEVISTS